MAKVAFLQVNGSRGEISLEGVTFREIEEGKDYSEFIQNFYDKFIEKNEIDIEGEEEFWEIDYSNTWFGMGEEDFMAIISEDLFKELFDILEKKGINTKIWTDEEWETMNDFLEDLIE